MKSKWAKILILVLVCFTAFCVVSIITRIYSVNDLQLNFVGALLGTVITAVVTVLLLSGQSSAEEVKERNVKVFEMKSEAFRNYIALLWRVWEDREVSAKEYRELTAEYYRTLMLFLSQENNEKIGNALSAIGDMLDDEDQVESEDLRESVITILNTLSLEISLGGQIDRSIFKQLEEKNRNANLSNLSSPKDAEGQRGKAKKTTFEMLGIKAGEELLFKKDKSRKCKIVDNVNHVRATGEQQDKTISSLASEWAGCGVSGFEYFLYEGETLGDRRRRLENA
jgi:hypothetical protein